MKIRASVKRRCKDCKIIIRKRKILVTCSSHPRHKQSQG